MKHTGDDMHDDSAREPGREQPDAHDALLGELTAALASEALSALDALPERTSTRAIQAGETIVRAQRIAAEASEFAVRPPAGVGERASGTAQRPASPIASPAIPPVAQLLTQVMARRITAWSGWLAAAALFAFVMSDGRRADVPDAEPLVASVAVLRDSLLQNDSSAVPLTWTATSDASAVRARGDVVWSARAQRGVMRIVGLLANDKARWQYQLWIFDKNRDQRFPVDGGVFDIPVDGAEVFVPIDARLPVGDATLFAITVEPVGGVVVSTRERIALTAGL